MKRIVVIGAGASGMVAAIAAARDGAAVILLEGMEKPGKKLLLTGSGRCNLTNLSKKIIAGYGIKAQEFVSSVLERFSVQDTILFFQSLGLKTYDRQGYVYPVTNQAQSVLQALLLELRHLGVKLKCSEKVTALKKEKDLWKISTASWTYEADAVILSAGSMANSVTGSDGSGYDLARMCGHSIHTPRPSLVPLTIKEKQLTKELAGVRMAAEVSVNINQTIYRDKGELQWTNYGISGIVVFQLGRYLSEELAKNGQVKVMLDLLPFAKEPEIRNLLSAGKETKNCTDAFAGILSSKAGTALIKACAEQPNRKMKDLSEEEINHLICAIKNFPVTVTGTKGFEAAQVCTGGVALDELDSNSMESKKMSGLYVTGELADVDGICGGYNLQWAWSSGYLAGKCASQDISM